MSSSLKRSAPFESTLPSKMQSLAESEGSIDRESDPLSPSTVYVKVSLYLIHSNGFMCTRTRQNSKMSPSYPNERADKFKLLLL